MEPLPQNSPQDYISGKGFIIQRYSPCTFLWIPVNLSLNSVELHFVLYKRENIYEVQTQTKNQ